MKIAVFGATGATGQSVVSQALAADHQVLALVRTPAKLKLTHDNLKVEEIDIFNVTSREPYLLGCDSVISCLGNRSVSRAPTNTYSESMKNIVKAMTESGVRKLVTMTSWYTDGIKPPGLDSGISGMMLDKFLLMLKPTLEDMTHMETYLKSLTSTIKWTCIKPPGLTNKPATGQEIKTAEGQYVEGCQMQISREDVAKFMLKIATIDDELFSDQTVAIGIEEIK
ncbi:unnamed protein product [Owenia fusiformis]|uniref:NAD(P)-binding domain-containing protein n=1 Tax=Owenia fusiformis TaxID=6347 RepID=A0A8S4NIC2_OWEFU|nr:unnamed protein product [Owenia fusiformis]